MLFATVEAMLQERGSEMMINMPSISVIVLMMNAEKIRKVLENATNVKMVIQGHFHSGHDNVINGINYHTLRAMCIGKENYYEILEI